jgi:GDP-L-fucose synthase
MKNILVTGATGFLGSHLIKKLKQLNYTIFISNTKVANLNDIANLKIYDGIRFDYIFHLAAVTKAGDYCLKHKGDQWLSNQTINTNILRYWKEKQPQAKMVCMGTSCSYSPDLPMVEENYLLGQPDEGLYTYAMTKRMLLVGLKSIEEQYGLKWLYFVPSTLYGPDFELEDNHFIFDFIRNCYNAKNKGNKFIVWGDGKQRRELIYVDDAIDAMITLMDSENEVFNLGSGQDNSINEFAKIVCENYDYDYNLVEHDLSKYVGVKQKKIDTSKIDLALFPKKLLNTTLEEGLKKTIKYFIKEYKNENKTIK